MLLLQVTTPEEWGAVQKTGRLFATPFVHLCTEAQLPFVLDRHFEGRAGLLLLRLDPAGLDIRWEISEPGMDPFPHLYGHAPLTAVRDCSPLTFPKAP